MSVQNQYDLDSTKITHVVTDNGCNFIKFFKTLHPESYENCMTCAGDNDFDDDYLCTGVSDILVQGHAEDSADAIYLPPHSSCLVHSMNLISSTDAEKSQRLIRTTRSYTAA